MLHTEEPGPTLSRGKNWNVMPSAIKSQNRTNRFGVSDQYFLDGPTELTRALWLLLGKLPLADDNNRFDNIESAAVSHAPQSLRLQMA